MDNELVNIDYSKIPLHVAIIMDGNRRWARQHQMQATLGHHEGAERIREIVETSNELGVKYLTLFAMSCENFLRSQSEVEAIITLLSQYLHSQEMEILISKNIKFKVIGDKTKFEDKIINRIDQLENQTINNTGTVLTIALNYSGKSELIRVFKTMALNVVKNKLTLEEINEDSLEKFFDLPYCPSIDLLIRTSGEERISNFMLWHLAYSELYFTNILWPDFKKKDFIKAVATYQIRERRYGNK